MAPGCCFLLVASGSWLLSAFACWLDSCWILAAGFCLLLLPKAAATAPATSVPFDATAVSSSPSSSLSSYFSCLLHIYFFNYYIRIWSHTFKSFPVVQISCFRFPLHKHYINLLKST
jgi:hypothetical protein